MHGFDFGELEELNFDEDDGSSVGTVHDEEAEEEAVLEVQW